MVDIKLFLKGRYFMGPRQRASIGLMVGVIFNVARWLSLGLTKLFDRI